MKSESIAAYTQVSLALAALLPNLGIANNSWTGIFVYTSALALLWGCVLLFLDQLAKEGVLINALITDVKIMLPFWGLIFLNVAYFLMMTSRLLPLDRIRII